MKPFSLEEFIKNPSQKVITRDGRSVRIICTNVNNGSPVIAVVKYKDGHEAVFQFKKDGHLYDADSILDLFFFPIKTDKTLGFNLAPPHVLQGSSIINCSIQSLIHPLLVSIYLLSKLVIIPSK